MTDPLVSIIIPTKNNAQVLEKCLQSIKNQSYKNIEVIIVDSGSRDETLAIAKKYKTKIYQYVLKVDKGKFDAPYKRNYGARKAKGKYIYYLDADMELTMDVIKEAVNLCEEGYDAIIIPEDSYGEGFWAKCKQLERRCYWRDDFIEAPRFFKKEVWVKLGGLDESLGGGGDDWDLFQKLLEKSYRVARTKSLVMHYEGKLDLVELFKKRFMYGRDAVKYFKKRPEKAFQSYFPIRKGFLAPKVFFDNPILYLGMLFMRVIEYLGGLLGIIRSALKK